MHATQNLNRSQQLLLSIQIERSTPRISFLNALRLVKFLSSPLTFNQTKGPQQRSECLPQATVSKRGRSKSQFLRRWCVLLIPNNSDTHRVSSFKNLEDKSKSQRLLKVCKILKNTFWLINVNCIQNLNEHNQGERTKMACTNVHFQMDLRKMKTQLVAVVGISGSNPYTGSNPSACSHVFRFLQFHMTRETVKKQDLYYLTVIDLEEVVDLFANRHQLGTLLKDHDDLKRSAKSLVSNQTYFFLPKNYAKDSKRQDAIKHLVVEHSVMRP